MKLKSHPNKSLESHLLNVGKKSKKILDDLELNLTLISKEEMANIAYLTGISHDFGKATSFFQRYLENKYLGTLSHHGLLSALFGYITTKIYLNNDNRLIPISVYAIIKKHHGNLEYPGEDISRYFGDLKNQINDIEISENKFQIESIYNRLLYNFDFDYRSIWGKLKKTILCEMDD